MSTTQVGIREFYGQQTNYLSSGGRQSYKRVLQQLCVMFIL